MTDFFFKVKVDEQGNIKVPQGGGLLKQQAINDNDVPLNPACPDGVGLGGFCWNSYGDCQPNVDFGVPRNGDDCYKPVYRYTCQQYDPDGVDGPMPMMNVCDYSRDEAGNPVIQFYALCGTYYESTSSCTPPLIASIDIIP